MNQEIKRLLKLSSIPGFRLSPREQATLDAWKSAQEAIVIKPPKKMRSKASKTRSKASLDSKTVEVSSEPKIEKIQNIVTDEEKTLNEE